MKFTNLLSLSAALAVAAFALGLALNALALPAYAVASAAFLGLILAHDYSPRRRDYALAPVGRAERLPYAA
ncbi:MAG: hypothetical protein CFE26_27660 [Verrucomicrobiales bacterium VVV1]|nr:MAG: hypothetical protein CFE26_27660 [Verrucomicrobiales bacterium VVV1]